MASRQRLETARQKNAGNVGNDGTLNFELCSTRNRVGRPCSRAGRSTGQIQEAAMDEKKLYKWEFSFVVIIKRKINHCVFFFFFNANPMRDSWDCWRLSVAFQLTVFTPETCQRPRQTPQQTHKKVQKVFGSIHGGLLQKFQTFYSYVYIYIVLYNGC